MKSNYKKIQIIPRRKKKNSLINLYYIPLPADQIKQKIIVVNIYAYLPIYP